MQISTIGLDLGKRVFQVHGTDASGACVLSKRVSRSQVVEFFEQLPPCLVGLEACGSAHHWARVLSGLGHEVRLIPPQYVKPYVKRNKTDAADAAAICEAVSRPWMRFVAVKSIEQQGLGVLYKTRDLLVRQRTMGVNAVRGHLAEFGLVVPQGLAQLGKLAQLMKEAPSDHIPDLAKQMLTLLFEHLAELGARIGELDRQIAQVYRENAVCRRLGTIPGVGPITALAVVAKVADATTFRSGRHFAAWLGLVPSQHGTGGRLQFGPITKRGDSGLRTLLVCGAMAVIRQAKVRGTGTMPWLGALLTSKKVKLAAVALANKLARIIWALLVRGEEYRPGMGLSVA
jgi:transposase